MKDRERQRTNRRKMEEQLGSRNAYGLQDPTPKEAVSNIIREKER